MNKLASIPAGAYGFGAVVVVCGTYLLKGDSLSFGVREGFNIERNISTKLDVQFNQLLLRFNSMENDLKRLDTDIKNWDSRIRRLEENIENVQSLTFRHVGAIDFRG